MGWIGQNQLPKVIKGATFCEGAAVVSQPGPPPDSKPSPKITHTSKREPSGGQQLASIEVEPPAKQYELTEHGPEGHPIVAPKVICGGWTRAISRKAERAAAARTRNLAEKIEALRQKRGRYGAMLADLERTGENQISLTDPDSRAMAAHTKVGVGYNIQIAVDAKNKMIVEQAVTNQVVDMGLLKETAESARAILDVENIDVVADRGYFKIEDIEACEKAGLTPHVPKPQRGSSVRNGFFRKDEFQYDPDQDVYICPAGETLSPNHEGKSRDLKKIDYSNPAACPACPLRSRCTTDRRRVSRLENEAVLDRMAARLKARPGILDRRRELVEHPFGSIKQWMNQGAFSDEGPRQCPG